MATQYKSVPTARSATCVSPRTATTWTFTMSSTATAVSRSIAPIARESWPNVAAPGTCSVATIITAAITRAAATTTTDGNIAVTTTVITTMGDTWKFMPRFATILRRFTAGPITHGTNRFTTHGDGVEIHGMAITATTLPPHRSIRRLHCG